MEEISDDAFIYAVMSDYGLSSKLPFKNHVDLHSFNKEVEQKCISNSVRDVLLAYAIPALRIQVSNSVNITAKALKALDEGDYTVGACRRL